MDGGDLPPAPPEIGDDRRAGQAEASPSPALSGGVGTGHDRPEVLAKAISSTLGAVMWEFDTRAVGVARTQDELALSIDRLTGELDKLLEDAPLPFIMQHAAKISSIRKRVSAMNLLLKSIQRRIDNIDRMLSAGVPTDRVPPDIVGTSSLTL